MADKATFVKFSEFLTLKRYSPRTIKLYVVAVSKFQNFIGDTPLEKLEGHLIISRTLEFIRHKNYSASSHKQVLGALQLFYKDFYGIKVSFAAIYPSRKQNFLPQILSKEEVEKIIRVTGNLKHRTILMTIYALGLRRGEVLHLKVADIDGQRMLVHIKNAKGKKDRVLPLSNKLLLHLREYYKTYRPGHYLFYGTKRAQYSPASLRSIFLNSCKKAGIRKDVTLHSLRHAYATHLLDTGTDVRMIQQLLGHTNIKTTMRYIHVTTRTIQKVKSPLDFLDLDT